MCAATHSSCFIKITYSFIPLHELTVYIKKKLNNFHVKLKSSVTNKKFVIINRYNK